MAAGELAGFGGVPPAEEPATGNRVPTRAQLESELAFLDDATKAVPQNLLCTSLWAATAWQHHIAADELPNLARVITGRSGEQVDRSPSPTRTWASRVLEPGADLDALLATGPVPAEKFTTDTQSPLMVHTVTKAAATTTAGVSSIRQMPGPLRPRTHDRARRLSHRQRYKRSTSNTGHRRNGLLALGITAATQSSTLFGISGLIAAGVGGYLITFGAWQISTRLLAALAAVTLTGAVAALAAPVVRRGLFGTSDQGTGYVGRQVHWLATDWWHPLLMVGILMLLITVVGAASAVPGLPSAKLPPAVCYDTPGRLKQCLAELPSLTSVPPGRMGRLLRGPTAGFGSNHRLPAAFIEFGPAI